MKGKAYVNWSSGKDAALALFLSLNEQELNITKLVTTVNAEYDRVSMHGLRASLLREQAESIGLPLKEITFPGEVSMEEYSVIMKKNIRELAAEGFTQSIFGDIFLEDLKEYRDGKLALNNIEGVYPLWKRDTKELAQEIIKQGFKAIIIATSARLLDESFCGRLYDQDFLNDLPEGVDPCGENGEFHTFVYDGPIFKKPINFIMGEKVLREFKQSSTDKKTNWDTSFWYCDLMLADNK